MIPPIKEPVRKMELGFVFKIKQPRVFSMSLLEEKSIIPSTSIISIIEVLGVIFLDNLLKVFGLSSQIDRDRTWMICTVEWVMTDWSM